ncbi:MAG: GMC family oxidoreductase [Gammaproteobacteria bacterium]|nr:GMC family oxidoreductase [Gammaproteobacteria bacterium]
MAQDFDVCVIGSGAGGGPVAWSLSQAGYSVLVLEKGPWLRDADFAKDELACCRRSHYTPNLRDEQHVLEDADGQGGWRALPSRESGRDFWNGNLVGGSSNLMSGFFHRMKPKDFRLLSEYGPIEGANLADWPISYADLEPYFTRIESLVGVSGQARPHSQLEPRSTADFPLPPTAEHPVANWIDQTCEQLGLTPVRVARAILPQPYQGRHVCSYSGYCGSYGCNTGAKGSARVAFIEPALASGRCQLRPNSQVRRLISDAQGRVREAEYLDAQGQLQRVSAKLFVVACQAIESARLLLASPGPAHQQGLGNHSGQLGRNLLFSAGGAGGGYFTYAKLDEARQAQLRVLGPFVNRALQHWYEIQDPAFAPGLAKGGTIEFLMAHPNAIPLARSAASQDGKPLWGLPLKRKLERWFSEDRKLSFEVFNDWLPTDDCFVSLDPAVKDKWGMAVARVRLGAHPRDLQVGRYLAEQGERVLKAMGADWVSSSVSAAPPPNLVAGGCRFGSDPAHSVLDPDCRVWGAENLFVTDASFMPTGGSVPYTWTIYANALRVAERIAEQLAKPV